MKTRFDRTIKATTSLTSRFRRDEKGVLALMLALSAVPFFLAAGVALDAFRAGSAKAEVQASLDAAALAAAAASPSATDAQRRKLAEDAFAVNIAGKMGDKISGAPVIEFNNGEVTVSYNGSLPTTVMKIGGFDNLKVSGSSTATMRAPQKAEIAMVLDYSLSMNETSAGQTKYVTMKNAAIDMVNGLTEEGTNTDVQFALVPFSHNVYATLPSSHVLGAGGATWTGCTFDRQYPYNTGVTTPTATAGSKWGQAAPTSYGSYAAQQNYHCDGYFHNGNGFAAHNLKLREMSSDHAATISRINSMSPYGYTHISLGLEFGWHMVDPGQPFAARDFDDPKNKKFIVLLTDGEQTTPAFGPGGARNVSKGEDNLETLCENIRGTDITLITIAFALDDADTENRLKGCATNPAKHFFKAEDSNDLTKAFEEIQNQIASAIYLSR